MSKTRIAVIVLAVVFVATAGFLAQHIVRADNPKAVSADELLALIAGNAVPQDIVHKISQDGLSFRPDDAYRAQLKDIGADGSILGPGRGKGGAWGRIARFIAPRSASALRQRGPQDEGQGLSGRVG